MLRLDRLESVGPPLVQRRSRRGFWVNDALMALFFLLVGLEIRCELHQGMLGEIKLAVLPVLAALGGVLRFRHHAAFRAANAGVNLGAVNLQANATLLLLAGVAAGRVIGKPLRILLATVLTVRLGWCACLAFEDDGQLAAAKLAVLIGSTLAAIIGLVVGRRWLRDSSQPARGA